MCSNNEALHSVVSLCEDVLVNGERTEADICPIQVLHSVNKHLENIRQFIEIDYNDKNFKSDAVNGDRTDVDSFIALSGEGEDFVKSAITEIHLPLTPVEDTKKFAGEKVYSSNITDRLNPTEAITIHSSRKKDYIDPEKRVLINFEDETESSIALNQPVEQNKTGDAKETNNQLISDDIGFPNDKVAGFQVESENPSMNGNVSIETTSSRQNARSENNSNVGEIRNGNVKGHDEKEDRMNIKEILNRNTVNMQDLKEIGCETVNGIVNSIHEEMSTTAESDKKNDRLRSCPDGAFRPLADVVVNKDAMDEKISDVLKGNDMDNLNGNFNNSIRGICNESFTGDVDGEILKLKKPSVGLASNIVDASVQIMKSGRSGLAQGDRKHKNSAKSNASKSDSEVNDKPALDEDTICGIWNFRPDWLQKWATPRTYLVLYSILGIIQGTFYSFLITAVSTLEKRFAFKSKVTGAIMVVDEITPLFLGIIISYLSGLSHRPRIVALGMLMNVAACFFMVLPYIIYGPAKHLDVLPGHNNTDNQLCDHQENEDMCNSDDRPPTIAAVMMFLLASFLKGFSNLAYYAIGLSYMDDNSKKKNTAFYLGIAFALRLFGPTLGFLMSSVFLKMNENPFEDPGYGPDDPRWIGGWWMGFMIQGILLLFCTVPLAMFPRRLPNQAPIPNSFYNNDQTWLQKFSGLLPALKRLVKNPLFMFMCLNAIMSILGSFGHYVMLPKYMEYQFRLTASEASLYSGPPGLITLQVVTVVGGFLIWKFRPTAKFLISGMALSELFITIGFLVLMIPKCEKIELSNIGFTADGSLNLQNKCNAGCMCTTASFTPLCGPDGKTSYFSPCHAGCTESRKIGKDKEIYNNCTCVTDELGRSTTAYHLKKGFCVEEGCWSQALAYIVLLPVFYGISNILKVSHTMVLLRSIAPEDKTVALGAFETLACLFGFIPYPILFGALVDSACIVWEQSCGKTGNCWFYDMDKFNYTLHGVSATFSTLSALSLVAIYFFSSRLKDLYEDEVLEETNADNLKKKVCDDATTDF